MAQKRYRYRGGRYGGRREPIYRDDLYYEDNVRRKVSSSSSSSRKPKKRERRRFFANAVRGKGLGGKWTTEDWYFTGALIVLAFILLWLVNNYHPFINAPTSVFV